MSEFMGQLIDANDGLDPFAFWVGVCGCKLLSLSNGWVS